MQKLCKNVPTEPRESPRGSPDLAEVPRIEPSIQLSAIHVCHCPKVLIVDDTECNLFVLQSYMRSVGVTADEARNGQDALEQVAQRSESKCCQGYKLIVMDINMPVMDGLVATREINARIRAGLVPATPIIALSAGQLRADDEHIYFEEIGFAAYISKPTSKENYVKTLKTYGVI